jgi:cytochrome bd-type quinol oxidase subunit 1
MTAARWYDEHPAGEVFVVIPDEATEENRLELKIPYLGGLITSMRPDSKEIGLTRLPKEDRPPVAIPPKISRTCFMDLSAAASLFKATGKVRVRF